MGQVNETGGSDGRKPNLVYRHRPLLAVFWLVIMAATLPALDLTASSSAAA